MERPAFRYLLCEERTDGIVILTIDRPEVMNALNHDCQEELCQFASYFDTAAHLKSLIITGAGDKAFAAGADIRMLEAACGIFSLNSRLRQALLSLENCSKPVLCAVNGYAFGGGFELALACDIRIVSENALFALPEVSLGILPGAGGTQRLARMAGIGVAKEVILAGRRLSAREAVQYGLAMKAVPLSGLMDETLNVARRILAMGPAAIQITKGLINAAGYTDPRTGQMMEGLGLAVLFETKDKAEGVSAYLERRRPNFSGR